MTSRPTVTIISADGAASSQTLPLPAVLKAPIRTDIVQYVKPKLRTEHKCSETVDNAC